MAKKKAPPPRTPSRAPSRGPSNMSLNILIVLAGLVMVAFFMPTLLLVAFAMLPTFVAIVVDRGPKRYGGVTVGGLNFAGVAPYLMDLWAGANDVPHALNILGDVFALVMIFGAAAFGWLLYSATPGVVGAFIGMTSTRRIAALRARQQELLREWGPEVAQQEGAGLDGAAGDEEIVQA
ncbi:hypothetical protein ACM64Y_03080 [Novispirillum sp. DQ9]|uniref:hypothetical protein n=1 Tax=Novispirillum sp. DQ9 TaxID=3398612 RepID=UPI003C7DD33E